MQAKILNLMERQVELAIGTHVVVQSKETDPNTQCEKCRKRGAIEFTANDDPLQAYEWIVHTQNIYETLQCTKRQRVALAALMFLDIVDTWWTSVRPPYRTIADNVAQETFKTQLWRKFILD